MHSGSNTAPLLLVHWQSDALTTMLDLIQTGLGLIRTRLDLIRARLDLILFVLWGKNSRHFFVYRMFTSEGGRDIWQTTVQIILAAPLLAVL
jgi:hypothetical protein